MTNLQRYRLLKDSPLATPITVIEGSRTTINFVVTENMFGKMDIGATLFAPVNVAGDPDDDITTSSFDSPFHLINPTTNNKVTFTLLIDTADMPNEVEDSDSGEWKIGVEFKAWFNPSF